MADGNRDGWLFFIGLLYTTVVVGMLFGFGSPRRLFEFHPFIVPLFSLPLTAFVVALRLYGVRISWWAVVCFITWLVVVVGVYLAIYSSALAAV